MIKEDCFAFSQARCRILKERVCDSAGCTFYKTSQQYRDGLNKYPFIDYMHYYKTGEKKSKKGGTR